VGFTPVKSVLDFDFEAELGRADDIYFLSNGVGALEECKIKTFSRRGTGKGKQPTSESKGIQMVNWGRAFLRGTEMR
jgi:hypothetical protein